LFGKQRDESPIAAIFRAILGREPSRKEYVSLNSQYILHGDVEAIARDLLNSKEFSTQMLPQLMVKWSNHEHGKKIFFLHVPKTAGSSVRLALTEAFGLPPILIYGRAFIMPSDHLDYYPFWAGHANLDFFPSSHEGFTVFRESRSRLLSNFRQYQRGRKEFHNQRILLSGERLERKQGEVPLPDFLSKNSKGLALWFYSDSGYDSKNTNRLNRKVNIRKLSDSELQSGVERGLTRIKAAAWTHDSDAIKNGINIMTGAKVESIPNENLFSPVSNYFDPVKLSREDMRLLRETAELDDQVTKIAISKGLIPELDQTTKDQLFEVAAKRLKFELP
jgi:hypothetical protein